MSSLGKFLECRKCYILLVTCALVIYLICMPSALGPAALGLRAYISGKSLVPMLQLLHVIMSFTYVLLYSVVFPRIQLWYSILYKLMCRSTYSLNFIVCYQLYSGALMTLRQCLYAFLLLSLVVLRNVMVQWKRLAGL